jgi:hypothetical protein
LSLLTMGLFASTPLIADKSSLKLSSITHLSFIEQGLKIFKVGLRFIFNLITYLFFNKLQKFLCSRLKKG